MSTIRSNSDWRHDSSIDRMRARARLAAVLALTALMLGGLFAGSLTALMHPLIAAVAQLDAATHGNPEQGVTPR